MISEFLNKYIIYKHLRKAITEAEARKASFIEQMSKWMDSGISFHASDTASFHLVAHLQPSQSDLALTLAFAEKGIITHPLSKCYFDGVPAHGLIIGYSCVNKAMANEALAKMAKVYRARKSK